MSKQQAHPVFGAYHVFSPLKTAWRIFVSFLLATGCAMGFALLTDFDWIHHFYMGIGHTQSVLDRTYANSNQSPTLLYLAQFPYWFYFKLLQLNDVIYGATDPGFQKIITSVWPYLQSMIAGLNLFGLRLGNLIIMMPLLLLLYACAATDGFVARYIRRESGGHESATRFHYARHLAINWMPAMLGGVWLTLPIVMPDTLMILGFVAISATLLRVAVKYYKKYL